MKPTTCKHFNGVQHDICNAGVRYDSLEQGKESPCLCLRGDAPRTNEARLAQCAKLEFPTHDELAKYQAEVDASIARFAKVGPIIKQLKTEHKGKSWKGIVECPVCKGKLHIGIASYNGHTRGQCETADCLAWIE